MMSSNTASRESFWGVTAAVFCGGVLGGGLRLLLVRLVPVDEGSFPFVTLLVNLLGCALIAYAVERFSALSTQLTMLLSTGFCGALTTFSAVQLELFELVKQGYLLVALLYFLATVGGCATAVSFGRKAVR